MVFFSKSCSSIELTQPLGLFQYFYPKLYNVKLNNIHNATYCPSTQPCHIMQEDWCLLTHRLISYFKRAQKDARDLSKQSSSQLTIVFGHWKWSEKFPPPVYSVVSSLRFASLSCACKCDPGRIKVLIHHLIDYMELSPRKHMCTCSTPKMTPRSSRLRWEAYG